MAKYSNTIVYNLETNLDSRGIDSLRKKLSQVQTDLYKLKGMKGLTSNTKNDKALKLTDNKELEESYQTILKIQKALNSATNFSTGSFNTSTFLSDLQKMNVSTQNLVKTFSTAGVAGQQAFNQLAAALGSTEAKVSRMSTTVTKMFNTFQNTLRWGITASIFETASNSIGRAVDYVKDLDRSLNDIRIISGYNAEDMNKFADSANKAAQALGKTTTEYTNASLIYIQQGKTLQESNSLAELTLKTANVTGQATAEVSEQLTSLMNGYQISVDNMEASVDKLAKVAAVSASDLEELATAESKVASTANALGVSQDQLVSQLSTIISVTRQAPESVGNAMKTIYARLGDLQLGETLEDGTTLGSIGEALNEVGVNIQSSTGDLRDMGDVIEELMGKWQDLDTAQKQALAVKLAGKYQYNNLMALLENSKMYEENLEAAQTSLGTINQQQQIYLDSLEGKLNTLQSTFEGFINSIFDVDDIKPFIDDITGLIKLLTGFTTSIGTTSIFSGILGVGAKVFSGNIGDQAMKASENRKARKKRQESIEEGNKLLSEIDVDSSQLGKDSKTFQAAKSLGSRTSIMNEGQRGQSRQVLSQMAKIENDILDKREKSATILNKMEVAYKNVTGQSLELKMNEEGQVENLDQALLVLNSIKGAFKDIDKSSEKASDSAGKMLASLNSRAEGVARNKNNGFNAKTRDNMFSASTELDDFVKGLSTNKKLMNSNGESILSSLPQYQAMTEANTAFGEAVSKMPTKGKISQTVSDEVEGAFNKSRQAVVEFIGALQRLDGVDEETAKSIQELLEKLGIAKSTLGGLSKDVENFSDSLDMKQLASDAADFVGSLAQAYSAFQSIKSLGKIVNDSDMESGEKISSFIENLLFSAPMLITSMVSLSTSFTNVKTSLKNWNNGLLQSAGIAAATATATDRLKVAVKGVMTLLKSNRVTLLLSLIPTAISFAMGAMEQQAENAKQEAQEVLDKYDELKDKAEQTQQAQQKVKENYDIYKQTGKVTDELKNSIQAYADTLDVPLSKQDLWNENIDKTIEKLNEATNIQANGMATAAKNAADQYQTNFLNEQASKRASLTDHSTGSFNSNPVVDTLLNTEGALNDNESLKKDLESIGADLQDSVSITDGIELLYKIVNHPQDVTEVDSDLANQLSEKYLGDMGLNADLNSLYSAIAPSIDFKTPGIDDPVKIQELFEKALGSDLSELMFGLNDKGELEVTVKANPDLAKAASQLDLFSTVSQEDLWRLAGVSDAEEGDGDRASLKWRIGQGLRSGQTLSQDENILGYKSSSLTAAKNELAGILYQKQNNGETITLDTLLDLFQSSDTIKRMNEEGFSSDDLGGIAVDLADLFNITLDENAKKQIEGLERDLSETSKNAADVAAEQERAAAKQRAAQYVGENQFGLQGTDYIDKRLLPGVTHFLGISEDDFYSTIESNRGRLASNANYENIFDYIKKQNDSGADMDLVAQLLASEDGLINAINGNTDALDSQYDVLLYQKNLKQGAEERYRASQAFTGKSDKAIDAELEAANQTINEKLNSTGYSLTDDQKTSLIADVYSHLDEVIAGTYDWDAAIKKVVANLDDLSDATKTTQEAFDKASPQIMGAMENQLKEKKGDNYTDEDVKRKSEGYGQAFTSALGDEGAQAVFTGISSGLFDVKGIQNWVTSALEAGASKEMIVEWLKEAVQNGVHVDINAEYDGELDSQIFEKDRIEREAQEKADTWDQALYGKANRIRKETGVDEDVARIQANKEVTDLDASLKELNLTADDVIAMGIDLNQSNEAIIEQVKAIQSGDAEGIEAAGNFNGLDVGPLSKFADTDKNGFNDAQQELWEYAKGLGYTKEEFAALVEDANRAGLSTEEFRQHLENLTYGLDSISKNAQEAAEALARAGVSIEQRPVYDEFGNATGSYTSDVQETVSNWDPWMTDQLASVGMFDKENTAVFQDFLGLTPEIQFAAIPYLDSSQLNQQVAELNLDPPDFFLKAQIVDVQDAIESVQSSISNGSDIDADALEKIYSVAPALREINLASKEGEQALKDLNTQLNSIDLEALSNERNAIQDQIGSLTQQVSDYDRGKIGVEIDKDQALKDIDELNKQLDKINTEIDIKIKTNADQIFDDMQSMEDEIESVKAAFNKNGGIINAETFQQALEYYPDLINYTTEYGNNLLQVSSEGQAAWVAAAEAQQAATIEEKQAELQALAQYYFAQADAYEAAAAQYDQMANAQLMTDEEVSSSKASIDENLTNALAENDTLVADNSANATTSEMKNSSDLVNQANSDNALMVSNTQSNLTAQAQMYSQWANSAIRNANQVANAMSKASKGQTSSTGTTPLTIGASYGGNASVSNTTGNTSTTYKSTSGSDWNANNYRKKAQEEAGALRKAAQANRDMGNKLLGESTAIGTFTKPGSNSVGGKGSGSGSGSGDGSGSSYDPKTKEKLEDEADRYEKVNAQIDKLNNALEQLNTEEERLVGFNRINIIQKETENIKRQIEVYKEKLELQEKERDEIKKRLEDDFKVEFDSEGYISNYQKKFEEYLGGINHLIDQYNSTTTEEGQEALDKEIEKAKKAFEDFKDLVSKYDDINSNTIKETEKEIQDLHDKIEDMITDLFNKAVEAVDTIKEVDDAVVDLKKTFRSFNTEEDDPFLSAEISDNKIASYFDAGAKSAKTFFDTAIARLKKLKDEAKTDEEKAKYQAAIDGLVAGQKLQGQGVLDKNGTGYLDMALQSGQLILQNIKQYNETGKSDLFGEDQQAMMEAAKTVFDQLTDMASNLREEIDNLRDSIIDAIDMVADEIEKREDLLDSISNRLDHVSSMSQILHGNTIQGYEEQNKILAVQSQLADQRLAEATQELDYWNKIASTVIKGSKEEEEALEHVREATEKKNEAIENSVNLYKQQVQASANLALAQWQKQWLGTDDMEWAQTQWEMMNRNADYYLDDVNKAYNIQKLQSQYTDLLDGANTLDIQTKITDQMNQQLEYLRTKTNLSEYDVSYAQAQLEILKQQIALEEAQANKSQMKLRRDSQGNYNYVYTANEDNVKNAQDGLLDAQNNAYNLSKDQMKQTQEDSFSAFQQAKQLLLDIWSDTTLGVTEQKERMQAVIDNLVQYLNMTGEQLSTSQTNLLESFYGMVDSLNDENIGSLQEIYDKLQEGSTNAFDSIDTRWNTTITTLLQNKDKFADSMADLQKKMEDSLTKYNTSIGNASKIAKENIGDISDSFNGVKSSVDELTDSFGTLTNKLQGYIDKIGGYSAKLKEYQTTFDSISQENGELRQTITDLQDEINKMKRQEAQGKNEGGIISTTPSGSSGKGNGKGDGKGDKNNFGGSGYSREDLKAGIALAIWNYGLNSGWGNDPDRSAKLIKAYGQDFANEVQDYIDYWYEHDDNKHLYVDSSSIKFTSTNLVGYDTGGYTGDWSDGSGKLALLHSKEIVLNASDTQNILKAVESVRAMTAAMKGATLAEAVGSISSIGKSIETANSKVDQNVNITAEFPNATSADEIREAILGLNNQVLHYTHRKA